MNVANEREKNKKKKKKEEKSPLSYLRSTILLIAARRLESVKNNGGCKKMRGDRKDNDSTVFGIERRGMERGTSLNAKVCRIAGELGRCWLFVRCLHESASLLVRRQPSATLTCQIPGPQRQSLCRERLIASLLHRRHFVSFWLSVKTEAKCSKGEL